jgi:ABC-type oligopeptide transport system substrate-binding subunit
MPSARIVFPDMIIHMSTAFALNYRARHLLLLSALLSLGLITDASAQKEPPTFPILRPPDLKQEAAKASPALAVIFRELSRPGEQYEKITLNKVEHLLSPSFEDKDLSRLGRLQAAEKILRAVAWHLQSEDRSNDRPLEKLRSVRAEQLSLLVKGADWDRALPLAERLLAIYPNDGSIGAEVQSCWSQYAQSKLRSDFLTARAYLSRIDRQFVHSPEAKPVRDALAARAGVLLKEAAGLPDDPARDKLAEALTLWPRLPGLRDEFLKRQKKYQVLYVGVRSLPEFLSPATAWTDPEKQVLDLVFEGLVEQSIDPALGRRYEPRLTHHLPAVETLKRRFLLRRDAHWSDGERVTATDIRHTVQLLGKGDLPGRVPAWNDMVKEIRVERASFDIDFGLKHGCADALALFTFKVLPPNFRGKALNRADDPDFAKAPVGSGPYLYLGRHQEAGRTLAVFGANPHFDRPRSGPIIREIRFLAWKDATDLPDTLARSALLLNVPTEQLQSIKAKGIPIRSLTSRRVNYLAINHQGGTALTNLNLRRALALAIDRDRILTDQFRGSKTDLNVLEIAGGALAIKLLAQRTGHAEFHHAANGPFPVESWACCQPPRVPAQLFDPVRAKSYFRSAHKQLGEVKLTLKYPTGEANVEQACKQLADQIHRLAADSGANVTIAPIGLAPHALKEAIHHRKYDLAYHHLDLDHEIIGLWPLFDPQSHAVLPGGSNILGYDNDGKLASLFRAALDHRQFSTVRDLAHSIHAHLVAQMPIIPLWQLHYHVAVPAHLITDPLDPVHIFLHAAQWKLPE